MTNKTFRRWAYGREDRSLRDVFSPTAIGVTIVIAAIILISMFTR